ncbi:Histone-lysine N-methyltransferase SETMAR, partial [Camponotus floridanus]
KLMELRFQLIPHLPYSSDLATSDYYLFPTMKKWLAERKFYSNEEVIAETNAYFAGLPILFFGRNQLKQYWTKNVSLKGDYIEK